jgi:F-type H+-transporting ATPase subunit delta
VLDFLLLLNSKRRLAIFQEIAAAYDDLLEDQLGKVEVDVIVAHRLSADELEQVRQRVSGVLKKDAVVHQYVDESIIGGLIIKVQDQVIDASVKSQLEAMRRQMLAARSK